jgi:IS30 family transposase
MEVAAMKNGRPAVPRAVQVQFWEGVRSGLGVQEAGAAAGVGPVKAFAWFKQAGGVKSNGPRPAGGRYLSAGEREEIAVGLAAGDSLREIAERLGRAPSTISREVRRNSRGRGSYRALAAQGQAQHRAARPKTAKLAGNAELRGLVAARLKQKWSPEQISTWLRRQFPGRPELQVSHETIYQAIYVQGRGALRRELAACLRTGRALRRPRRKDGERRGKIPGMVMISERPAEAGDRAVPGHWEGGLIEGKGGKTHLGTLVERSTRFTMLVPLPGGKSAPALAGALIPVIGSLPAAALTGRP